MTDNIQNSEYFSNTKNVMLTPWTYIISGLILLLVIGGFSFINRFNKNDYARDYKRWEEKLNLISSSRAEDVSHFISGNFAELRTLADNPSLKLYLTELGASSQGADKLMSGEPAQKSYLRNLLLFTAQRGGFTDASKNEAIPANIPSERKSGLAIFYGNNQMVVSTNSSENVANILSEHAKEQKSGEESLIDLQKDKDGNLYIGFSVPIYSIQGERDTESQIGKIIAIKSLNENLFSLLKQVGVTEKTQENLLVRIENNQYLSPLMDSSLPLAKYKEETFPQEKNSSSFYNYVDYRGEKVLAVVREISGANWQLITKIDASEAFAESGAHRASLVMLFTAVLAFVVLLIIGLWWYSYSRHTLMASSYFRELAEKALAHEKLLILVTNNQPESIYILDKNNNYCFANKKAEENAQMENGSLTGKRLADVQGAARAEQILANCNEAIAVQQTSYIIEKLQKNSQEFGGLEKIIRSAYVPLPEIPVPNMPSKITGVLVVEQDISEVVFEREKRLKTLRKLVEALINLVDKRDPFAANHSLLVSQVACQIAINMGLDDEMVETIKTSASLMNIGKILIPKVLLTKTTPLHEDEKNTIRESMDCAFDLIKDIPFDGKVAETIRQWQEKWDGSGKLGLKAEQILLSARIIAVANAFIGMVSPRSWRNSMEIDKANKFLLEQAENYFDHRVVIALVNYVENQSGRAWLEKVLGGALAKKTGV